jgi:hypothetical protein
MSLSEHGCVSKQLTQPVPAMQDTLVSFSNDDARQNDFSVVKIPVVAESLDFAKGLTRENMRTAEALVEMPALVEMIAKVVMSAGKEDEPGSEISTGEDNDERRGEMRALLKQAGLSIAKSTSEQVSETTRAAFDDSHPIKFSSQHLSLAPKAPRRGREGSLNMVELPAGLLLDVDDTSTSSASHSNSRDIMRSSSARTASEEDFNIRSPRGTLPEESTSDMSAAIRDLKPRKPARRRSSQEDLLLKISEEELMQPFPNDLLSPNNPGSSVSSSGSTPLGADQIESYVMARTPIFVKEKLPPSEWKRIFYAAAESQKSGFSNSRESGEEGSADPTIVDRIPSQEQTTSPTDMSHDETTSFDESGITNLTALSSEPSPVTPPRRVWKSVSTSGFRQQLTSSVKRIDSFVLPPSIPSRSWNDNVAEHAPRVPSRHCSSPRRAVSKPRQQFLPQMSTRPKYKLHSSDSMSKDCKVPKRSVVFNTVQVRLYERILEVNPCTSSGPSVGIGWRYIENSPVRIDEVKSIKREPRELILPRHIRECTVREWGYCSRQIAKAVRASLKIKNQRKQTYSNLRHQKVEYIVEKSRRKVGRLLRFGKKKEAVQEISEFTRE